MAREFVLPDEREIHIFHADLTGSSKQLSVAKQLLSAEEIERAERFVKREHSERFIRAHAILREILSTYLNIAARDIQFACDARGKPFIKNDPSLFFNMSDSHAVGLYGIRRGKTLGVDIERVELSDGLIKAMEIAERFFSPAEIQQLQALPTEEQMEGFYRLWVLKESYLKATGQGLSFPLSRFTVDISDRRGRLLEVDGDLDDAATWRVQYLTCPSGYMAAVAGQEPIQEIQVFEWKPNNSS